MKTISAETRHKLHELCKTFLSGQWAELDEQDLIIESVSDGNINNLYFCSLPENMAAKYRKVVVRFIVQDFEDQKNDTHVLALNVILSEERFSPKLLAVFSVGMTKLNFLQEEAKYMSRYFNFKDDFNGKHSQQLARVLAKFHSLKVPIPKNKMIMSLFNLEKPFPSLVAQIYKNSVLPLIMKQNYQVLKRVHFINELNWLNQTIEKMKCPVLLSHNDFNKKNILIQEREGSDDIQIFLIDFDWTAYNYRGMDFGQYFSSWGQEEPDFGSGEFPTDQQMSVFIDSYIEEMSRIFGESYAKQDINSRQQLIKESKVFALFSYMKDFMYFIFTSPNNNGILAKAETRLKCYEDLKKKVLIEYKL